jgi:hypothetical protein
MLLYKQEKLLAVSRDSISTGMLWFSSLVIVMYGPGNIFCWLSFELGGGEVVSICLTLLSWF